MQFTTIHKIDERMPVRRRGYSVSATASTVSKVIWTRKNTGASVKWLTNRGWGPCVNHFTPSVREFVDTRIFENIRNLA
jgi:hypothetical protein